MKNKILIVILSFSINFLFAQNEGNIWYFGNHSGLDFNSGSPVALSNSAMNTYEGCSSISDNLGNLLFYTDGDTVWNSNHVPMSNGTGLTGNNTSTQSALIIKKPGNQNIYYIFSLYADYTYSVVDMTLNSGLGDVTAAKNVMIYDNINSEKQCATRDANGVDVWVMMHHGISFYAYKLSATGLNITPVQSTLGLMDNWDYGQMKFSPQGDKIVYGVYTTTGAPNICLLDFNNSTGLVSNGFSIANGEDQCYGIEFSPDGSKLYAENGANGINQYDLNAGSPTAIIASQIQIGVSTCCITGLQTGPDKKIYASIDGHPYLAVINNPDSLGIACNFADTAIYLSIGVCQLGLPELISDYYNPPLGMNNSEEENLISCFPNPFSDFLYIRNEKFEKCYNVSIYDVAGRKVIETLITSAFQKLNLSQLSNSIYFLEINYDGKRTVKKIVMELL